MNTRCRHLRRDADGTAVIVVIALLAIILIFVAANLHTLHVLGGDLRLIERQQTNRLARVELITNSLPVTNVVPTSGGSQALPSALHK